MARKTNSKQSPHKTSNVIIKVRTLQTVFAALRRLLLSHTLSFLSRQLVEIASPFALDFREISKNRSVEIFRLFFVYFAREQI